MIIPYGKHYIDKKDIIQVSKALKNNLITQGPLVEKFERKICNIVKAKYAIAVSSCSAGLHIACASLDKKNKKKNIITSPISFVSTANAILHNNFKPVFIDIDNFSLNINPIKLKNYLKNNKSVKAIISVHLSGNPYRSKEIYEYSKKKKLFVIEDAAHSFGAKYDDGNMVGSCKYSDITVFSFHPVKTITTGEGGVITTNNKKVYQKLIKLRSHGIEKNKNNWKIKKLGFTKNKKNIWYYEMQDLGFNYRITDIQCALGLSQLNKLKKILNKRAKLANIYDESFKNINGISIPQYNLRNKSSNHLYILNINFKKFKLTRNEFMQKLYEKNIITQVHYIPIPLHPYFKAKKFHSRNLENSLRYYKEAISIPIFYNLGEKEQNKIILNIKKLLDK